MTTVLILSYNGLPDLKGCIDSVRMQDVPTQIMVIDNGSTDGTTNWMALEEQHSIWFHGNEKNLGVSAGWNQGLRYLFGMGAEKVLVLNQDVLLGWSCLRELLSFEVDFVTAFPVTDLMAISSIACSALAQKGRKEEGLTPYPCFSAFLISRRCWDDVGEFDEGMFGWAGDCDYHVRAHRKGVHLWKSKVPFWHLAGSATRNAPQNEREWFIRQANRDRAAFKAKWGCEPGTEAYSDLFKPESFGVEK